MFPAKPPSGRRPEPSFPVPPCPDARAASRKKTKGTGSKAEEIYLYFKEDAETDSLDEAIKELGGDFTEEEIRLVRIKFMSELGN